MLVSLSLSGYAYISAFSSAFVCSHNIPSMPKVKATLKSKQRWAEYARRKRTSQPHEAMAVTGPSLLYKKGDQGPNHHI